VKLRPVGPRRRRTTNPPGPRPSPHDHPVVLVGSPRPGAPDRGPRRPGASFPARRTPCPLVARTSAGVNARGNRAGSRFLLLASKNSSRRRDHPNPAPAAPATPGSGQRTSGVRVARAPPAAVRQSQPCPPPLGAAAPRRAGLAVQARPFGNPPKPTLRRTTTPGQRPAPVVRRSADGWRLQQIGPRRPTTNEASRVERRTKVPRRTPAAIRSPFDGSPRQPMAGENGRPHPIGPHVGRSGVARGPAAAPGPHGGAGRSCSRRGFPAPRRVLKVPRCPSNARRGHGEVGPDTTQFDDRPTPDGARRTTVGPPCLGAVPYRRAALVTGVSRPRAPRRRRRRGSAGTSSADRRDSPRPPRGRVPIPAPAHSAAARCTMCGAPRPRWPQPPLMDGLDGPPFGHWRPGGRTKGVNTRGTVRQH